MSDANMMRGAEEDGEGGSGAQEPSPSLLPRRTADSVSLRNGGAGRLVCKSDQGDQLKWLLLGGGSWGGRRTRTNIFHRN